MLQLGQEQVIASGKCLSLHLLIFGGRFALFLQALVWWTGKTTAAIFAAWVQHVQQQHQRKHDGVRALFSYAGMLKRKAFLAWQEDHQGRRALQQQAQHAFASMADYRLCLAFDAW